MQIDGAREHTSLYTGHASEFNLTYKVFQRWIDKRIADQTNQLNDKLYQNFFNIVRDSKRTKLETHKSYVETKQAVSPINN